MKHTDTMRRTRTHAATASALALALALVAVIGAIGVGTAGADPMAEAGTPIEAKTSDGVTVYAERYFGDLDDSAPLIVLFHQGGADARSEYAPLVGWLNGAGYRAIAWDSRAGGDRFQGVNRTVETLPEGAAVGYCEAYPDLVAALEASVPDGESAVVWGSSYTAALVFRLAAEYPTRVSGVVAFSPAGGGPLADCLAREWLDQAHVPMLAFRPASEMNSDSSREQRAIFEKAGVTFHVIENGVHGSSMLVDERTKHDMSGAREIVTKWLGTTIPGPRPPSGERG